MRKFYRLRDDMHIPGRWHLDDPIDDEGSDPRRFTDGVTVDVRSALNIDVQVVGIPLDFTLTAFAIPVASTRLADAFAKIGGIGFQRIPVTVNGQHGYDILNATRLIRCIDESRSEFMKWTEQDHRADLAGQYRSVWRLRIDPTLIPADVHAFRIDFWEVALIVSEELVGASRSINALGPVFQPVFD